MPLRLMPLPSALRSNSLRFTVLASLLMALAATWIYATGRCDMQGNLGPLFKYFTSQLNSIDADWWVDYGTLLGAIRQGSLLPHEFDLDLAAREEDCPAIIARLKPKLIEDGYHPFEREEWIAQKYNPILGHDGFLHKACLRVYSPDWSSYVDIDSYKTYSPAQVTAVQAVCNVPHTVRLTQEHNGTFTVTDATMQRTNLPSYALPTRRGGLDVPQGYSGALDGNLLCNEEGIDDNQDPGGCRPESWLLPTRLFRLNDGTFVRLPHQPERSLEAMYGSDWRVPRAKGYKRLVCGWFPTSQHGFRALLLCTLFLPLLVLLLGRAACRLAQGRLHNRLNSHAPPAYTLVRKTSDGRNEAEIEMHQRTAAPQSASELEQQI